MVAWFYGGLFSDVWEILGLGIFRTLCSGNRLNRDTLFYKKSTLCQYTMFFENVIWDLV